MIHPITMIHKCNLRDVLLQNFTDNVATHVLSFMAVSLVGKVVGDVVASYATRGATSAELYPMLWDVIFSLEQCAGAKVSEIIIFLFFLYSHLHNTFSSHMDV